MALETSATSSPWNAGNFVKKPMKMQQVSDLPSLRGRHLLSERFEEVTKNLSLQKLADVLTGLSDPVRLSSVWVRRRVAITAAP